MVSIMSSVVTDPVSGLPLGSQAGSSSRTGYMFLGTRLVTVPGQGACSWAARLVAVPRQGACSWVFTYAGDTMMESGADGGRERMCAELLADRSQK